MYFFCTHLDQSYLPRFLALYRSPHSGATEFRLWALCLDGASLEA
jgi:hypothetical protein